MKRIYLFMLVLVAALAMRGDVAVQSMWLQPTDLTAVQMGRTDLTGAPCAVVRVVLPRDGVTFEGNVIGAPVFTSKRNNRHLILPAAGWRSEKSTNGIGSDGYYWSDSPTNDTRYAWYLYFYSSGSGVSNDLRYNGRSVRPVAN